MNYYILWHSELRQTMSARHAERVIKSNMECVFSSPKRKQTTTAPLICFFFFNCLLGV